MKPPVQTDPWQRLREATPARIGLARSGASLALSEVLALELAQARARDAVHAALDTEALAMTLGAGTVRVASAAAGRAEYLLRPDLGRRLSEASSHALAGHRGDAPFDLAIVVADGLSAVAAGRYGARLALSLARQAATRGWSLAPFVVATQARVALGDEIAAALDARAVVMLLGERPGLSAPDGLGAYLTFAPKPGVSTDADRNCVSNIRDGGLALADAAARLLWLAAEAARRGASGVALKDESGLAMLGPAPSTPKI